MARKAAPVDLKKLVQTIQQIESHKTFSNRSELYAAVAESQWGKSIKLTASVVYLRVKDNNLEKYIKTPMGRRGKAPGEKLSDEQKEAMRAGRQRRKKDSAGHYEYIYTTYKKNLPKTNTNLLNRARAGSLKAAIKLMCIQCCAGVKTEVKNCTATMCPLFPHRPYKLDENESDDTE